jgi:hypothetical protein
MTGGLPLISSSWRQAPWYSRPVFFFQLNTCDHSPYVTSSLTREWVCRLQLLPDLASAVIIGSESRGTVSGSRLPQHGGSGPSIYIAQEQSGPVIPPGTVFFSAELANNWIWSQAFSITTDSTDNIASKSSSIVACVCCGGHEIWLSWKRVYGVIA